MSCGLRLVPSHIVGSLYIRTFTQKTCIYYYFQETQIVRLKCSLFCCCNYNFSCIFGSPTGEGDREGERRRGAGAAVSRGMRRRPLLSLLLLLALLRDHGLLAATGGKH